MLCYASAMRCPVLMYAMMLLRICYVLSSSDRRYAIMLLRTCYAASGTDADYATTKRALSVPGWVEALCVSGSKPALSFYVLSSTRCPELTYLRDHDFQSDPRWILVAAMRCSVLTTSVVRTSRCMLQDLYRPTPLLHRDRY